MAKQQLPPPLAGKPRRKSKYSEESEEEMEHEDEGCGCGGEHEKGIMLKISVLLPSTLQPKD